MVWLGVASSWTGWQSYHVDLELTGRHLKKLTQGLLPGDRIAVPHQGGCAHVQAGQQPPPLVHGAVVPLHELLSCAARLVHIGLEVPRTPSVALAKEALAQVPPVPEGVEGGKTLCEC